MPYVDVKITREGTTTEQKATSIREMTRPMIEVLGENAGSDVVGPRPPWRCGPHRGPGRRAGPAFAIRA